MNLNNYLTFRVEKGKSWLLTENFDTLLETAKIADNATRMTYSNGIQILQISIDDNTWHIYCNRTIELVEATNSEDLNNGIVYYVRTTQ